MSDSQKLFEEMDNEFGVRNIKNKVIPQYIQANLNPKFVLRDYQKNAIKYYLTYQDESFESKREKNPELLFHMATGSGKTLIMAGLILDLYSRGFRDFLFLVNSSTIILKTKENFLSQASSKYLFSNQISILNKMVRIREVDSFADSLPNAINIKFTTIQDLHYSLAFPRENGLTLADFEDRRIVIISDEDHHLNSSTKKTKKSVKNSSESDVGTWEESLDRVFNANSSNYLLRFSATMDLEHSDIYAKYVDKIIFDYPLKKFREDGFSKEVSVEIFDSKDPLERAFVAVLMSQYRKKLMLKNKLGNKPVILFKSKTIDESRAFQTTFNDFIQKLDTSILINMFQKSNSNLSKLSSFLTNSKIDHDAFILELKEDFSPNRQLIVNSKDENEERQIAVNTLEDDENEYRCIFAVDKLNEGWDVLNLFDIVRLYDTRDPTGKTGINANKVGATTMSEAQLIGRGARYFPFATDSYEDRFRRKFDHDIENELRICETLSYHSAHNPKYIQELNSALQDIGIKAKESTTQDLLLKEDFKKTETFKKGHIYLNQQKKRTSTNFPKFLDYARQVFRIRLDSEFSKSLLVFDNDEQSYSLPTVSISVEFAQIHPMVIKHAIAANNFVTFNNLKSLFPTLLSLDEFIESKDYLGGVMLEVQSSKKAINEFTTQEMLAIASDCLNQITAILQSGKTENYGTREFIPHRIMDIFRDKRMNFNIDPDSEEQVGRSMVYSQQEKFRLDLSSKDWYVFNDCYGTSEEKLLVKYIDKKIPELQKLYSEIFLLRNEKFFKIFDFKDGNATEPDFILLLNGHKIQNDMNFQIFIEPKGQHLVLQDKWKEELLTSLKDEAKLFLISESTELKIWGLPFYQSASEAAFNKAFDDLLKSQRAE